MKRVVLFAIICFVCLPVKMLAGGPAGYSICITCHGANGEGNITLNSPAIAGQETWYLERQIKNFISGLRGTHTQDIYGMQMRAMALTLTTDEAISTVSNYVNSMEPADITNTATGGDAVAGQGRYAVCIACHGADGKGLVAMNSPDLTLQQDWYLIRQLQNFKTGVRGADPKDTYGMQMRPMAMILPDDQAILDVVAYISSLRN